MNGFYKGTDGIPVFVEGALQYTSLGVARNTDPSFLQSLCGHKFLDKMAEYSKRPTKHPKQKLILSDPFFSLFFKAAENPDIYFIDAQDYLWLMPMIDLLCSIPFLKMPSDWHNRINCQQIVLSECKNSNWGAVVLPETLRSSAIMQRNLLLSMGVSRTVFIPIKEQMFSTKPENLVEFESSSKGLYLSEAQWISLGVIYDLVNILPDAE